MHEEINEVKNTYYEYVRDVNLGCKTIAITLRKGELAQAFQSIEHFAEGLEWLLTVENAMQVQGWTINSRIEEAQWVMKEINEALENKDLTLMADLFEYELVPIFLSASEWVFTPKQ